MEPLKKHKVFHGEYSLYHWIELMLSGNIQLPSYQRFFVWDESQSRRLIQSINHGFYIPAVTIACVENPATNKIENIILDGQQRLTSLLLAYLGKYPVRRLAAPRKFAEEGDDSDGESKKSEWQFTALLSLGTTKDTIVNEINSKHPLDYNDYSIPTLIIDKSFLETHFLHFAFIVPDSTIDSRGKSRYLTNVFYSINSQGTQLTHLESRAALYYQGGNHTATFEPSFSQRIKVNGSCMDFVRSLTMISNYKQVGRNNFWASMDDRKKRENLYVELIRDFLSDTLNENDKLYKFTEFNPNLRRIEPALSELSLLDKEYTSIIDLDLYYTGILYYIMIEGLNLDSTQWANVKAQLEDKKSMYEANRLHKRNPAKVGYVRERVIASIDICKPLFPAEP